MNAKKTLVLALVLGVAVLYLTKVAMPKRERVEGERIAFGALQTQDIASIEVVQHTSESDQAKRFVISREANNDAGTPTPQQGERAKQQQPARADIGSWSLLGVRGAMLDTQVLTQYLAALRQVAVEGPLNEKDSYSDLSAYGLAKPDLTTIVRERSGRDTEIAFGKKNQYLEKRYVKVSGRSGIFLADEVAYSGLNKSSADLRSKTPFNFNIEDVRTVLLTSSQGRIEVEQPVVGEWKISEPFEYKASSEDVESLLRAIQNVTVAEFIDGKYDQRNDYGFGFPRASITIQFREGIDPQEVVFSLANANARGGGEQNMYFISSYSDTVFKLASDPSASLIKRVDDLRFKRLIDIPASEMQKVVGASSGSPEVAIDAAGTVWKVNGKESDPMFVEQLLNDMSGLKAVAFPEPVPADAFAKPFLVLTISKKGEAKEVVTVTIGREYTSSTGDTLRYARNSLSDVVFGVRDVEAKRVVPHEEALLPANTPTPLAQATMPAFPKEAR